MSIRNRMKSLVVGTANDIEEFEKINDLQIRKNRSLAKIKRANTSEEIENLEQTAIVHNTRLKIDEIKAKRQVREKQSKQRIKDTKTFTSNVIIVFSSVISTILSVNGLIGSVDNRILIIAILMMLSITLLNGLYLQGRVFNFMSRYAKNIYSLKAVFGLLLSLGITYASIYTNILYVKNLTNEWIVIVLFSSAFDLVPLWINITMNDFTTMNYNLQTQELYNNFETQNILKTTEKQPKQPELKTSQNTENKGFGGVLSSSDEEEKSHQKTTKKQPGRPTELNQNEFNELTLSTFKNGDKVTPAPLGLTYNGSYQRLRNNCPYIVKEGKNYIMQTNSIKLVKIKTIERG